jgi:hypothetical protein
MRLLVLQTLALVLTCLAWGSDVLHMMHIGADETFAEHDASTGNEEPEGPRADGLGDEVAISSEAPAILDAPAKARALHVALVAPSGDGHSLGLMRPPRDARSA